MAEAAPIDYPDWLAEYLADVDASYAATRPEDLEEILETGFVPRRSPIRSRSEREHILYVYVMALNDVIESLNTLSGDMADLPELVAHLKGKPSKRIELLIRCFYAEFFRGREVTFKVLEALRKKGFITKQGVRSIARALDTNLAEPLRARHGFAHGEAGLGGEAYNSLRIFEARPPALERMIAEPGVSISLSTVVSKACKDKARVMATYTEIFRVAYSTIVGILAEEHGSLLDVV